MIKGHRIKIRDKRADAEPRTFPLGLAIAVFVLVIVVIFFASYGKDILFKLGILIPNLNASVSRVEGIEVIRYDIIKDRVQHYDGVSWFDFKEPIELGDKIINYNLVHRSFFNYYQSNNLRTAPKKIPLGLSVKEELYPGYSGIPLLSISIIDIQPLNQKKGSVKAILVATGGGSRCTASESCGEIFLGADNSLEIRKVDANLRLEDELLGYKEDSNIYKAIAPPIIGWRDDILKTPIQITYGQKQSKGFVGPPEPEKERYVCVKKDGPFLIADLSVSVSEGAICKT